MRHDYHASEARLQESLTEITRLLERHRVLTALTHRQQGRRQDHLIIAMTALDPEDLASISEVLPPDVVHEITQALDSRDRTVFERVISYPDDCVGRT